MRRLTQDEYVAARKDLMTGGPLEPTIRCDGTEVYVDFYGMSHVWAEATQGATQVALGEVRLLASKDHGMLLVYADDTGRQPSGWLVLWEGPLGAKLREAENAPCVRPLSSKEIYAEGYEAGSRDLAARIEEAIEDQDKVVTATRDLSA